MGFVFVLKSKVHGAVVTESRLDYEGSLTLDSKIIEAAGLYPGEKILVANLSRGTRFETYVIKGTGESGSVIVNGAAAHLAEPGDRLILMSFKLVEEEHISKHKPKVVYVNEKNKVVKVKEELPAERSVVDFV